MEQHRGVPTTRRGRRYARHMSEDDGGPHAAAPHARHHHRDMGAGIRSARRHDGGPALGPSTPRPPADPGQFRLLAPADRSASLWGNRWLGFADAFTSWLEEAFRPHPEKLTAPAQSARLQRRWTSGPGADS
jgi:hypothetical protein